MFLENAKYKQDINESMEASKVYTNTLSQNLKKDVENMKGMFFVIKKIKK